MRLAAVSVVLLLTIFGFWACQYSMEQEVKANKMLFPSDFNKFKPKDSIYTYLAEQGFIHQFPSGTQIQIPGGVLMNKNGELVLGEVQLSIQEYRDAIDLLIAGIPMNLDKGMAKTAAAFKIEARQLGEKLLLDPTRNIQVKLACYEKEEDYSLYFLNEKNNHLDSLYQIRPEMNEDHMQLERSVKRMKPWIKFPLEKDHFAFNYKGILDIIYNNDLTNVSHHRTKKKMQQYGLRWSSLNLDTNIQLNGKKASAASMVWRNISRKPLPEWIKDGNASLEKLRKNRYRLIVEDTSGVKKFSTQIEPVISLKELFAFGPGFWKNDYKAKLEKVKVSGGQLSELPSAYRTFRVNKFGVYNWLKFVDEIPSVMLSSRFKVKSESNEEKLFASIFYLSADNKGIMYYPSVSIEEMLFFDDPNARIFSITEGGEILIFPLEQMSAIEFNQFKKMENPSFLFKLEVLEEKPTNLKELREILEVIL